MHACEPRVFKAHEWVEGLIVARDGPEPGDERLFSFAADGVVRLWELDAEQACDVCRMLVSACLALCKPIDVHHQGPHRLLPRAAVCGPARCMQGKAWLVYKAGTCGASGARRWLLKRAWAGLAQYHVARRTST